MSKLTEQLTQALADASQRIETLSKLAEKCSADSAETLQRLDALIDELPEQWRPPALLEFRQYVQEVSQQVAAPASIGADGASLPDPVIAQRVVQEEVPAAQEIVPREVMLPSSLKERTPAAKYYLAIGRGINTPEKLKKEFPNTNVNFTLYVLMGEKRLVEGRDGVLTIKPEEIHPVPVAQETPLPAGLTEEQAKVYRAIERGDFVISSETYSIVAKLKRIGAIVGDGRRQENPLRIKGQTHQVVTQTPSAPRDVSSHARSTAPMPTTQAIAIAMAYIMQHPGQGISYDVMRAVIPHVVGKQFSNVMTQVKLRPGFSGDRGTVMYVGAQPVTAEPVHGADGSGYRADGGALQGEVTARADGTPEDGVHGPPTSVKYTEGTPPPATLQPLSVGAVIEYLGRLSGRLAQTSGNQADRLEDYAARVAPPDNLTPEQIAALNEIGEALERLLDEDGDIDRFLAGLEQAGTSVPDITRYLDSLRTERDPIQAPTSMNDRDTRVTGPQKAGEEYLLGLSSYYGISRRMDTSLGKFQETAEKLPEEQSGRIERWLLEKVLPEGAETVVDEYAHALDVLRTALEDSLRREDTELLIRYLESQEEIDPEELENYLTEFDGQSPAVTNVSVPHVRSAGQAIGPADLRTDPVWAPLFSRKGGPHSEIVGRDLPYIAGRDPRLSAALKSLIPRSGSPDWTVYAIGQIGGLLRDVEERYGTTPAGVTGGLLTLLGHPDNQRYLGAFLHAARGQRSYLTTEQAVECLMGLARSGEARVKTVLRSYSIMVR